MYRTVVVLVVVVLLYFRGNFDCMWVSTLTGIPPGNLCSYVQADHLLLCRHQRASLLREHFLTSEAVSASVKIKKA